MKDKLEKLKKELTTGDDDKFKNTMDRLMDQGSLDQIPLLFRTYFTIEDRVRKHQLFELMASVIKKGAEKTWMGLLNQEPDIEARRAIIQIMWNARLDFSAYLKDIVEIACLEDELTGIEALTLIENMEGPFEEERLMDAKMKIIDSLNQNKHILKASKVKILQEILAWIMVQEDRII